MLYVLCVVVICVIWDVCVMCVKFGIRVMFVSCVICVLCIRLFTVVIFGIVVICAIFDTCSVRYMWFGCYA